MTRATLRRIRFGNRIARCIRAISRALSNLQWKVDDVVHALEHCEYCGENKWSGRSCKEVLGYTPTGSP